MVSDVVALPQVAEPINPSICADDGSVLQSLLLPELPIVGLVAEEAFGSLVGLNVILTTAWSAPIGMR
jgi:hypothetical protein